MFYHYFSALGGAGRGRQGTPGGRPVGFNTSVEERMEHCVETDNL